MTALDVQVSPVVVFGALVVSVIAWRLARRAAVGVCVIAAGVLVGFVPLGGSGPAPVVAASAVGAPAQIRADIDRAGSLCADVTPALIAAQLSQESGFNNNAVSPVGARGPAQFMPGTWKTWGTDGDGDGRADVTNPHDAIPSQGRFMCELARLAREGVAAGRMRGSVQELALAAYNAGPGAISKYGGVPPYRETRDYVRRITASMATFTASTTEGDRA